MDIKEKIKKDLEKAVGIVLPTSHVNKPNFSPTSHVGKFEVYLERPENPSYGDYSSNFAMTKFEEIKNQKYTPYQKKASGPKSNIKNPLSLAQEIVKNFPKTDYLEKVEAVPPGFINFYVKNEVFISVVKEILKEKINTAAVK